jgi:hypothetical protein
LTLRSHVPRLRQSSRPNAWPFFFLPPHTATAIVTPNCRGGFIRSTTNPTKARSTKLPIHRFYNKSK